MLFILILSYIVSCTIVSVYRRGRAMEEVYELWTMNYEPELFTTISKLLTRKHHSRVRVDRKGKTDFHVHVIQPELIDL